MDLAQPAPGLGQSRSFNPVQRERSFMASGVNSIQVEADLTGLHKY